MPSEEPYARQVREDKAIERTVILPIQKPLAQPEVTLVLGLDSGAQVAADLFGPDGKH